MEKMSNNCDKSQCASCKSDCAERKANFMEMPNSQSHIKKVISIMSGKGRMELEDEEALENLP